MTKENKSICTLPFKGIHIEPNGEIKPCCLWTPVNIRFSNIKQTSINQYWNSKSLNGVRKDMLNGIRLKECVRCYENELHNLPSYRTISNDHSDIDKIIENYNEDDFPSTNITRLHVSFNNICNIKCRTCWHGSSSKWFSESPVVNSKVIYADNKDGSLLKQITQYLPQVESIYFAGGEPLVWPEIYSVFDELIRLNKTDVIIHYNTNATKININKWKSLDYWKQFSNVNLLLSVDSIKGVNDIIRDGANWDIIIKNVRAVKDKCPNVNIKLNPTVSLLNILQLCELHKTWIELGLINPQDLNINILKNDDYYRIDVLPYDIKLKVIDIINDHINYLLSIQEETLILEVINQYKSVITFMMKTDLSKLIPKFFEETRKLDNSRNQKVEDWIKMQWGLPHTKHDWKLE